MRLAIDRRVMIVSILAIAASFVWALCALRAFLGALGERLGWCVPCVPSHRNLEGNSHPKIMTAVLWEQGKEGALAKNPYCAAFIERSRASILVACQKEHGLHVKQTALKRMLPNAFEARCIVCSGDTCTPKTVRIPFSRGKLVDASTVKSSSLKQLLELLPPPVPDMGYTTALFTQPLAILAVIGMMLLGVSVAYEHPITNVLLTLIGGRESVMPTVVLNCALFAHAIEALFALNTAMRLSPSIGVNGVLTWAGLVFVVGYPVLGTRREVMTHPMITGCACVFIVYA